MQDALIVASSTAMTGFTVRFRDYPGESELMDEAPMDRSENGILVDPQNS
jgi:hypothetical protein